jgi:hypothetical protein
MTPISAAPYIIAEVLLGNNDPVQGNSKALSAITVLSNVAADEP